jgi:hypothetical protein
MGSKLQGVVYCFLPASENSVILLRHLTDSKNLGEWAFCCHSVWKRIREPRFQDRHIPVPPYLYVPKHNAYLLAFVSLFQNVDKNN